MTEPEVVVVPRPARSAVHRLLDIFLDSAPEVEEKADEVIGLGQDVVTGLEASRGLVRLLQSAWQSEQESDDDA